MKMNKIGNRILAIFFVLLLVIPVIMMNRQKGKVSEVENRTLASFPQIFDAEGHLADGVRSGFEKWLGDNLGLRGKFVELATNTRLKLFRQSTSNKVEIGRDGWYFNKWDNNLEIATGKNRLSQKTLADIAEKQQRISDWYASQGIQYVLALVPSKACIYPEYIASGDYGVIETCCDQLEKYLLENTTVDVVNMKHDLLSNKTTGKLFLQHDSHWSYLGAYVGYKSLAGRLEERGLEIKDVAVDFMEKERFHGDLEKALGSKNILGPELVPYAEYDSNVTQIKEGLFYDKLVQLNSNNPESKLIPVVVLENEDAKNGTVLIYGDSLWRTEYNIPQWLGESFKTVVSTSFRSVNLRLDNIVKPDLVIFGCGERLISSVLTTSVGVPRLADSLPELPYKDMIQETADGKWVGNHGMWLDKYNGVKPEGPGEIVIDPDAKTVTLEGWAADFGANEPFQTLYLQVGDTLFACDYGSKRADLQKEYGLDTLLKTGFKIMFPADCLQDSAVTEISFIGVSADGQYLYTPVTYQLKYE